MSSGGNKGSVFSRLLRISGNKRVVGQGKDRTSNFVVDTGSVLQKVKTISITTVTFPNVFYNIQGYDPSYSLYSEQFFTATMNNTTKVVFQLEAGYYSAQTLTQTIVNTIVNNSSFLALDAKMQMTFVSDPISGKVTMEWYSGNSGPTYPYPLNIAATSASDLQSVGYPYNLQVAATNPFSKLGFPTGVSTPTTLNAPTQIFFAGGTGGTPEKATAFYVPNLLGVNKAYIQSSRLAPSNMVDETGNVSPIFLPIPITSAYGSTNLFECKQDILCEINYPKPIELNSIDFQLVDDNGQELNLQGQNLEIELRCWFDQH